MNNKVQDNKLKLQNDPELLKKTKVIVTEDLEEKPVPEEFGGRDQGLDPTRYGDWEFKGRCIDF